MHPIDHRSEGETDATLLPQPFRRAVLIGVLALLALGTYLMVARGPALLFDLARSAMTLCF